MVRTTLAQRRLDRGEGGAEAVAKFQQEINAIIQLQQVRQIIIVFRLHFYNAQIILVFRLHFYNAQLCWLGKFQKVINYVHSNRANG